MTMPSSSWEAVPGELENRVMDLEAWSEHVLNIAAERFERRLTSEISGLRVEMHAGFTAIRKELSDQRVELLKWSFAFWIGQLAAMTALLAFMQRAR